MSSTTTVSIDPLQSSNSEFIFSNRPNSLDNTDYSSLWLHQPSPYPTLTEGANNNEFIAETLYISVDPYLSATLKSNPLGGIVNELGSIQISTGIGKIIKSNNQLLFPIGTHFTARFPWRRFNLFTEVPFRYTVLPNINNTENNQNNNNNNIENTDTDADKVLERLYTKYGYSLSLTGLGMPSQTAFYGLKYKAKLTPNDILIVSGASGAVGSIVIQLAKKIYKVKCVIGISGNSEKCKWIKNELGADYVINYNEYRNTNINHNINQLSEDIMKMTNNESPTCYFDNTGGFVTESIFNIIGKFGRIVVCGQIDSYLDDNNTNNTNTDNNNAASNPNTYRRYPNYLAKTIYKELSILGFVWGNYFDKNSTEYYKEFPQYIENGDIKFYETIYNGFHLMNHAYSALFMNTEKNYGKIIVKI